tara:strand:- start:3681 stop:3989 length:309 start_codon:yes stop_codon:yes gene_type:complete
MDRVEKNVRCSDDNIARVSWRTTSQASQFFFSGEQCDNFIDDRSLQLTQSSHLKAIASRVFFVRPPTPPTISASTMASMRMISGHQELDFSFYVGATAASQY